jgi:hypothetical protein
MKVKWHFELKLSMTPDKQTPNSMSVGPLSVSFEKHLHELFVERLEKHKNTKAMDFIDGHDVAAVGVVCRGVCKETKPFYCFGQHKNTKYGISVTKCTKCHNGAACPYSTMFSRMKNSSKRRRHPPPDFVVAYPKELFKRQGGRCFISGAVVKEKCGDNDPYNMSPERLDNNLPYFKKNVVLICQFLQIGAKHDYLPSEIRSWFQYDGAGDDFVLDDKHFTKPNNVTPREQRKSIKTYDDMGAVISKTCTDCGLDKGMSCFYKKGGGRAATCKPCKAASDTQRINNSPYRFIKYIANTSKDSTVERGKKRRRNDDSGTSDDDLFDLFVSVIKGQGGRCAVTGRPFVYFKGHKFSPSPDRVKNAKGYIDGNVEFIIAPLNTACKPPNAELRTLMKKGQDK